MRDWLTQVSMEVTRGLKEVTGRSREVTQVTPQAFRQTSKDEAQKCAGVRSGNLFFPTVWSHRSPAEFMFIRKQAFCVPLVPSAVRAHRFLQS